jgi:serine/threonine protein kinase
MSLDEPKPEVVVLRAELQTALRKATLGEYEIYDELGSGGMGSVFLAHDLALDRPVAIKVMAPKLFYEPGMVERFKREARTAASLSHPHIIPVHAVGETEHLLYFVMKYVAGRPLDLIIRDFAPLRIEMVEAILSQVGSALAYAHRRGVIHRDVKPANIMLDEDGWAAITDFGIAKTLEATGLTSSGASVGTPTYMSPEQFGSGEVTARSDQYSLGVVGYEMLVGKPPFTGRSLADLVLAHLSEPIPDIALGRPDCPPVLASALTRMLCRNAAERWGTMDEALAVLRPYGTARDDPVRNDMVTLAKSGPRPPVAPRVPTSPVPSQGRLMTRPLSRRFLLRGRRWAGMGMAMVALAAVAAVVMRGTLSNPNEAPRGEPWTGESTPPLAPAVLVNAESLKSNPPPAPAVSEDRSGPVGPRPSVPIPMRNDPVSPSAGQRSADTGELAAPPAVAPGIGVADGFVQLGSRAEGSVVYLNGVPRLPRGPSVRWWKVSAGQVRIEVRQAGCVPWDTTLTVGAGDSISIGYRYPTCTADSTRADTTLHPIPR